MRPDNIVVIHVEGGAVTTVTSEGPWNLKFYVIDHDNSDTQGRWMIDEHEKVDGVEDKYIDVIERTLAGEQVPYPEEEDNEA